MGQELGNIEATRLKVRDIFGNLTWQRTGHDRLKGGRAVVSRLTGAIVRMILVMVLVATPSVLLVDITADTKQMVALVALFLGMLTFVEYNATYPSLVEFRDAPPFNRVRFVMLLGTVFSLSAIARGKVEPTTLTEFIDAIGTLIGVSMDFPYSPVRLATDGSQRCHHRAGRSSAYSGWNGVSYLIGFIVDFRGSAEGRALAIAGPRVQRVDQPAHF